MKPEKAILPFAALVLMSATGVAQAGPDWQAIQRARAANQAQAADAGSKAPAAMTEKVSLQRRGPRPQFVREQVADTAGPIQSVSKE